MRAAKIDLPAVENELISFRVKIAQTDGEVLVIFKVRTLQPQSQRKFFRMKLVPGLGVDADGNFNLSGAAVLVPGRRHHSNVRPNRRQRSLSTTARNVADTDFYQHCVLGEVRKDLGVIYPDAAGIFQLNLADDSVPT